MGACVQSQDIDGDVIATSALTRSAARSLLLV
jgi:hypothetical protein